MHSHDKHRLQPCPIPNGAAGLALLGKICRQSQAKERAAKYFEMSLRLDPFLYSSFKALAEIGDVENLDPIDLFGVAPRTVPTEQQSISAKPPLMETPAAGPQKLFQGSSVVLRSRPLQKQLETPNLTPIAINTSMVPTETPRHNLSTIESTSILRRARDVAARHYYPPSPETPLTNVTKSMRYLRGLDGEKRHLFSENTGSSRANQPLPLVPTTTSNSTINADEKPENSKPIQDILESLSTMGAIYQNIRRYKCREALAILQGLPMRHRMSAWAFHMQGRAYLELGDFNNAQRSFELMEKREPGRLEGLEYLSTVYWQLKKEVELASLAQRVVDWDFLSPVAWCVVGNCFSLQKDHETALVFFKRSLQLDPTFTYTHTLSGYEYITNEDLDRAAECFRVALLTDERHYNAWYGLGSIYHRQEKFDLAEYHFEKAVQLHPSSSVLRCNLGIAQYANGKAYVALDTLNEAFRLDPNNPQARYQRATIYSMLHRDLEALKELRAVCDAAPREAAVHFAMGKVLKRLGRHEEALKCFLTAMDLDPKDAQVIKSAIEKLEAPDMEEDSVPVF